MARKVQCDRCDVVVSPDDATEFRHDRWKMLQQAKDPGIIHFCKNCATQLLRFMGHTPVDNE